MKYGGDHLAAHHNFRIRYTQLNEVYSAMILRSFIASLLGIFVPIYLWNLHYPLYDILLVFMLTYLGEAMLEIPTTCLLGRFGPKKLMAASIPLLILHFSILSTIPKYHWPIPIIAISASAACALFWQAYHYDFSKAKHNHEASSEVSWVLILTSIVGGLAPFMGGYIATNYGINYLFGIAIALSFLIIIPLFKTGTDHKIIKADYNKLKIKKIRKEIIAYAGLGTHGIIGMVIWPLLVFLIVKSYQGVGAATSIALMLTLFITYFLGKSADHGKRHRNLKTGSFLLAFIWIVKIIASTFMHVFSLDFANNVANSFFYAPLMSEYYLHADEESRLEFISIMEIANDLSRAMPMLLLFSLSAFLSDRIVLILGLVIAAIGSLFISVMPPSKSDIEIKDKTIRTQRMIGAKSAAD